MTFVDYYKILEIDNKATSKDIKNAYRRLAKKYHPDVNLNNPTAEINFQKINEANNVLSDPEKRKKYDQYGKDWQHADQFEKSYYQNQSSNSNESRYSGSQGGTNFSDFFESMFGQNSNSNRSSKMKYKGEDYNAELHVDLTDAYTTHKQMFTVNGNKIRITIPAGIENGQIIKIPKNAGQGTNGGPNGDLYITFSITNNTKFKRLGDNLYAKEDLDLYTAILGGEIIINTMNGKVKIKVKPETQNGNKIKLKGKGFPVYKNEGQYGDLYVTYNIKIPSNLTEKQKGLFTELSLS